MMSSCPLQPQLATTAMMPWTTSGVTLCSMSGSAMVMLKEMVGILPCPRPNSFIFSRPSLASETAFGMNSSRSGLADADLLDQRRRVGERRRQDLLDHELKARLREQILLDAP